MILTNSEINTLVAACLLTGNQYKSLAKSDPTYRKMYADEAAKYQQLEAKLRENFYEGEGYKKDAIKTINVN